MAWNTVNVHVFKCKYHIQLLAPGVHKQPGIFRGGTRGLAHSHTVISHKRLSVHFLKELMESWTVGMHETGIVTPAGFFRIVRKIRVFGNGCNHVHAPAVHALIHPEFHQVVDLPAHSLIFPVQVRLLLIIEMQVILSPFRVIGPGTSTEAGAPVIRFSSIVFWVFPDVIIAVRIVGRLPALHKPLVLI